MRIFTPDNSPWPDRENFVDKNNVLVGYDMGQNCCERAEWFITDKDNSFRGTSNDELEPYCFDVNYFKEYDEPDDSEQMGVKFRLVADGKPDLFLILSNSRNGYYSHGFTMNQGELVIHEGSL